MRNPEVAHMTDSTDRIQKQIVLKAPRERVWQAISDSKRFGTWFGIEFDGEFVPGARLTGTLAMPSTPYDGLKFDFSIDRIEPMDLLSYRWHPFAVDRDADYSMEPMTLIVFELEDAPGGTRLTVTESGFDKIPLARRAKAFAANEGGWGEQLQNIEKYLARSG